MKGFIQCDYVHVISVLEAGDEFIGPLKDSQKRYKVEYPPTFFPKLNGYVVRAFKPEGYQDMTDPRDRSYYITIIPSNINQFQFNEKHVNYYRSLQRKSSLAKKA